MRKIVMLIMVVMVLFMPIMAFAHGGRTDSAGGHTDRDTGEYHYHHGHSAHQHTNGECPYDFDDRTGESSGSSSNSSSKYLHKNNNLVPQKTTRPEPSKTFSLDNYPIYTPQIQSSETKNNNNESENYMFLPILFSVFFVLCTIPLFFSSYRKMLTFKDWIYTVLFLLFSAIFAIIGFTIF